jgi:cation transport regulator ChaC
LANPHCPSYAGEQPLAQTAGVIASAVGPRGSNRDYLEQLSAQLDLLAIEDAYIRCLMDRMQALVGP